MAILTIPLKHGATIEVDPDVLLKDDEYFREAMILGLSAMLTKKMSKISKANFPDDEAVKAGYTDGKAHMKAEVERIAAANAEELTEGKYKVGKKKAASKVSGKVQTEAMRIARGIIKDAIKADGGVLSHYKASEISAYAKEFLATEEGAAVIAQAEKNLAEREAVPTKGIDLSKLRADPALVAKAEAEKAERKKNAPLSAKQAGKAAPRKKPAQPQASA